VSEISDGATTTAPAIMVVNQMISRAIEVGASDVHFEPQAKHLLVRVRVDGVMRELGVVPKAIQLPVTSRLKIMGELDIADKRSPQDGRVSIRLGGQPMDLRIAVLPTTYGEQVVLRILQRANGRLGLEELGMNKAARDAFTHAISQPYGAVLACGPTGSGKTTTLYAALDHLNDADRVLMTIEDPVEFQIEGINQIEVTPKSGLTFGRGLRTILRSDPDVMLVGEIRDEETARIAVQAAMTGHLVLTTLHAHNAAASVARLKDMGVEPSLLATSINCIIAQRLARRLCADCREAYEPDADEMRDLGLEHGHGLTVFRPKGCLQCAGTGYAGRVAVYEVLNVNGRIRRLIEGTTEEIFAAAVEEGMTTLRQDGLRLVLEGVSSLDEIRRVTGDRLQ
jgi:type II secretory ATPase GspE/PulE/Tfp pilus assembly ATPase PilB-like protein